MLVKQSMYVHNSRRKLPRLHSWRQYKHYSYGHHVTHTLYELRKEQTQKKYEKDELNYFAPNSKRTKLQELCRKRCHCTRPNGKFLTWKGSMTTDREDTVIGKMTVVEHNDREGVLDVVFILFFFFFAVYLFLCPFLFYLIFFFLSVFLHTFSFSSCVILFNITVNGTQNYRSHH